MPTRPMSRHPCLRALASILAASVSIAADAAPDSRWQHHVDTPDSAIYVRRTGAASSDPHPQVWLLSNYVESVQYAPFSAPAKSSTMVLHFDCPAKRWAVGDTIYFGLPDASGSVVWSDRKQPAQLQWKPLGRDTLGTDFVELACSR